MGSTHPGRRTYTQAFGQYDDCPSPHKLLLKVKRPRPGADLCASWMPNDNLNTVTDRPCPTCHGKARSTKVSVSSDSSSNPFALHKLVAAGSLALTMSKGEESVICRQPLAEDRWHSIADPNELRTLLPLNGQVFLFELAFLVKHKFVCATYSARRNTLFVRLYIIPFDLPNVQGQLRLRDQVTILKPAMGILQRVLSEVSIDKGSWEGGRNLVYHCERFLPVSQVHP